MADICTVGLPGWTGPLYPAHACAYPVLLGWSSSSSSSSLSRPILLLILPRSRYSRGGSTIPAQASLISKTFNTEGVRP